MPMTFMRVMRSPIRIPEITSTRIGVATMMMLALTGEVRMSPWKKNNWFMATPVMAHSRKRHRSPVAIRSGRTARTIQKSPAAPSTRSRMKPDGARTSGIKPFATT